MAQRTIAAFFQSRPPPREALGDATNATAPVAFSDVSRKSNNDDAARTTTPPPKRARVAAPLPFAKGADVMDVRGASSRIIGAQFCNVNGREILLCGDAWGAEDLTRPISRRWREKDESSLRVNENRAADVRASPSGSAANARDDAVVCVGDVVIRGTNGLVARADGAVIRVYDASNAGAPPVASLCLAHDSVSSDASTCECTRRATRLDARAVTRMTSHRLDAESDTESDTLGTSETSEEESLFLRANLAATTAGGELVALAVRREKPKRVVATLLGRALLTEGTFQHAFPDADGSLSLESRLGPFCMWRPKEKEKNAADADGQKSGTIARFAVAASATGALCFITLSKTKPGDASAADAASRRAVATLDRVVSPHLPSLPFSSNGTSQGRARSVIHDVVTWTRRREEAHAHACLSRRDRSSPRAAAVSVGGDGVLAITHFDAEDDALDTAWRVVPDTKTKKKTAHKSSYESGATAFVAVCDLSCTAVTMSAAARDATVWRLEDETEIRKVPLGGSGSDGENRLGRVSGLAIDTRWRLIAASFDDARSGRGAVRVARGR